MTEHLGETIDSVRTPTTCAEGLAAILQELEKVAITRKVVVFSGRDEIPITRIEIAIQDSKKVAQTVQTLGIALQQCGLSVRTDCQTGISLNEIWLTFPHNDGSRLVLLGGTEHAPLRK